MISDSIPNIYNSLGGGSAVAAKAPPGIAHSSTRGAGIKEKFKICTTGRRAGST